MKILRLRLCNLSSLRENTAIDFTLPPLANSGLFAITGPTGAGKSTLLDAITLALYGRVARYGSTPSPDAVMSRHTGECSAEIEFSCAAGIFRSVWQLQRARKKPDGKLQAAKRRVIALPAETVIAESIKDADAKILELTGLDYERFLRSVLLAQGDFAAFLKAGPKERTDLLQQVTGTAIYQEISQSAFRRAADAEQAHANLLRDHQAVPVLDAAQRAGHEASLAANTTRLTELSANLQALTKRLQDVQRLTEIEQATRILEAETQQHAQTARAAAPMLARLGRHEKAAPFLPDLTTIDRLEIELAKNASALRDLLPRLPEFARLFQVAETTAQNAQSALATETDRQTQLRVVWTEVTELDQIIATLRATQRQLSEHHTRREAEAATLKAAISSHQAALIKTANAHKHTIAWLAEHQIDATLAIQLADIQAAHVRWSASEMAAGTTQQALAKLQREVQALTGSIHGLEAKLPPLQRELEACTDAVTTITRSLESVGGRSTLAELEARRDRTRDQRVIIEQLTTNASRLRTVAADLGRHEKDADQISQDLTHSETARSALRQQQEGLEKLLTAHRTSLSFAEKIQSLEAHRAELRDEAPCPLCGAVHHPYTAGAGLPPDDLAAARGLVAVAETDLSEAQHRVTEAEKRHASLLADQKRLAHQGEKLHADHISLKTAWNTLATPHDLTDRFNDEPALIEFLRNARIEEDQRKSQLVSVRTLQEKLEQSRVARQFAQSNLERVATEVEKQSALVAQSRGQLPDLEAALDGHRMKVLQEKAAMGERVSAFASFPADPATVPALLESLKTRAATFARRQSDAQAVEAELGVLRAKVDTLIEQLTASTVSTFESQQTLAAATTAVVQHEQIRRDKFGNRLVADAQQEADFQLRRTREAVESARRAVEELRQSQATAHREHDRLAAEIVALTAERTAIAQRLVSILSAAGFEDERDARDARLSAEDVGAFSTQSRQLEARSITLAARAASLTTQRHTLPPNVGEDAVRRGPLEVEHVTCASERDALQGTLGAIRALLKNDDEQRIRLASFTVQLEIAHREFVRWNKLRALIGSADGSSFARFAQGLTLEKLAILANLHLTQLNPRYSIRRATDGEAGDLELEIVDHYQADVARPMRSLSGGESFLVSLALALGLSELASGRTTIESVFIDEGFGSLDADTLETAMSALENLQSSGKTIGVISHVPAMQERIPAQIKVTKESGGWSHVTLVA